MEPLLHFSCPMLSASYLGQISNLRGQFFKAGWALNREERWKSTSQIVFENDRQISIDYITIT